MRQKYDFDRLNTYCIENNITLTDSYIDKKVTFYTNIIGICNYEGCNEKFCKKFYLLYNTGPLCKNHTKLQQKERLKNTCLERFGTVNPIQNKEIKEKAKKTILLKYGVTNTSQLESVKQKRKQTLLERYGHEHALQCQQFKDKFVQTCIKNHGVSYPAQSEEVKNKCKETCMQIYGTENPLKSENVKEKVKQTCIEKYNVPNAMKNIKVQQKGIETRIEKYGYKTPAQNPEIMEKISKSAYKRKDYTFPSGKVIQVQGYEPFAIDQLIKNGTEECDIITGCKNVPEIWYEDETQKQHRHFVDIYIPSQRICIEVKSTWTAKKKHDSIFLKQEAAKKLGYKYEIWIYNGKGERVELHE